MKKKILSTSTILTILLVLVFTSACTITPIPDETPQDEYAIDNLPGSENTPYELDKEKLAELVDLIEAGEFDKIHSLLIIHNDSLVMEEYFRGWTRHMRHRCFSTTKSITSALIGIAMDQGKINGLDEKMLNFFPEYDDIEKLDERKESITLENVLTMSAGFTWDETSTPYFDIFGNPNPENDVMKMAQSGDWIKYVLDLPMSDDPGTKFVYNSGCTILLSGIIKNKTGQSAEEFAEENLFNALGITNWEWETGPNGITGTAGGIYLHPVNMAMFGYLYLKNGLLNGEQIVPESWVKESTAKHITANDEADYGYQWWRSKSSNTFSALGHGGQLIIIIPFYNIVVVTTADNSKEGITIAFGMLTDYILPALQET